ncbi:hypothetical protein MASR1M65_04400 [Saprospiraceae bacterium]
MGGQAIKAGAAVGVMGDMATDGTERRDDRIARFRQRHEAVKVGQRPGCHAGFRYRLRAGLRGQFRRQ